MVSRHGLLTTVACNEDGGPAYALEGSVFIAGAAVQWIRDGLGLLSSAGESGEAARSVEDNGGVYFVPAFVGLGAPHWEPEARGTIVGLSRGTTGAHLIRAALEAMTYGTAEVLEAMEADSGVVALELRVDGGAAMNDWMMEYQAGILDRPVRRPAMPEATALGAAGLAGISVGVWRDGAEFIEAQAEPARFRPVMGSADRRHALAEWRRAVRTAIHWARDVSS